MARPLRIQYPGAVYHITCRGNAKTDIYKDDKDRNSFLEILSESQNIDRKSTRLNSSHIPLSRMPSSA